MIADKSIGFPVFPNHKAIQNNHVYKSQSNFQILDSKVVLLKLLNIYSSNVPLQKSYGVL
jgi:hypothetical protein